MSGRTKTVFITGLVVLFVLCNGSVTISTGQGMAESAWPCAGRDASNTRFSPYYIDDFQGEILWSFDTERAITSTPVIGEDGNVFVGSVDNKLYSISSSGMLRWHFTADSDLRYSPLLDAHGNIYFTSREGTFYALDRYGHLEWRINIPGGIDGHPVMGNDGMAYFASKEGIVYAVQTSYPSELGGSIRWSFDTGKRISASPTIGPEGTIYIGTNSDFFDNYSYFFAISQEGEEIWSVEIPTSITTPATVGTNGNIYFGCTDGSIYAISQQGEIQWTYYTDGRINSSPAVTPDGTIYVGSMDNHVYSIQSDGSFRWKYETDGYISTSPAVSADGIIIIGSSDGYLYVFNQDGALKKRINMNNPVLSSASIAFDGTIYVGNNDGTLFAINGIENLRPGPPRYLRAEITEEELINLTWEPPDAGELTHYNIYRKIGNASEVYLSSVQSTCLYYLDHSVEAGKNYTYRVTAENDKGESPSSEPVYVSILAEKDDEKPIQFIVMMGLISALAAISLILTVKILRMKKAQREALIEDAPEDEEVEKAVTCPFCGHFYIEKGGKNYGRCPRCKNLIHPSVF